MTDALFHSQDLVVRRVGGFSAQMCVVTFASFTDHPTLDRPGFAEQFLRGHGIDAIHVIARLNEWYQHGETLAAMAAVRAATKPYARVVTYGSSMGAYAAIRLAGLVGAQTALAMSPQFSVLPHRVPFEYRWMTKADRQRDVWETAVPLPDIAEPYVLFDPLNIDSLHAERLAAQMRIVPVRLRGAGHQVASFLQDIGLLQRVVLDTSRGPLNVARLEREAWGLRRQSAQARLALAARVRSQTQRIALLRAALALAPQDASVISQLGLALTNIGAFAEALDLQRAALALEPNEPRLLIEHATTLAAAGELPDALAMVAPLAQVMDDAASLHRSISKKAGIVRPGHTTPVNPGPSPGPAARPIRTAVGQVGFVLFGPYVELRPGCYVVDFAVRLGQEIPGLILDYRAVCIVEVVIHQGRTVLARRHLSRAALRDSAGTITLGFEMPSWTVCEFRVRATGIAALVVEQRRPVRRVRERLSKRGLRALFQAHPKPAAGL